MRGEKRREKEVRRAEEQWRGEERRRAEEGKKRRAEVVLPVPIYGEF
jgi:hypothetical protein